MPASAATARTVSPPGPSLTSTASAADSSSRSISELGVRDRRPTAPASLMQTIFSYEDRSVDPLTTIERCYTVVERYPNHIARRATPIGVCAGKPQRPRWWILAVLCLSVLLVAVDNTIVNIALPT